MPELPDVEGLRRLVADVAAGQLVVGVRVPAPEILRNTTPQAAGRALAGCVLGTPTRRGKWLHLPARAQMRRETALLVHFGMDGTLDWVQAPDAGGRGRYDRFVVRCESGELRYRSARKLGGVWLLRGGQQAEAVTGRLGPDALGLGFDALAGRLAARRGGLKSALMDQRVVAGLGNLTVDETLWRARLHPRTRVRDLGQAGQRELHRAMREVLAGSVPAGRVPDADGWLTKARAQSAPACPRCGTALSRGRVAGRGTAWCPRCQS